MNRFSKYGTALAVVALLVPATEGSAQVRFSVAGGPTFAAGELGTTEFDRDNYALGYHVQLSAGLATGSPIGLRVDGAWHQFPTKSDAEEEGNYRTLTGSLNALLNIPVAGLNPYLIGGVGAYSNRVKHEGEDEGHPSSTNLGVNIGAGVRFSLPGLGIFIESRYHSVFTEGSSSGFVPVSFGFTF